MSSRNYFQSLPLDVSPDLSPSGVTSNSQPDPDLDPEYLQYRDWVPPDDRNQESLDYHNKEILERWNRALRCNLCKWCAKLDLESLRTGPKALNWDHFKVTDNTLTTDAKWYFGSPRRTRDFTVSQGQTVSKRPVRPVRPGCPLCRILRNICREIVPDSNQICAEIGLKEPIPMCLHDCDKVSRQHVESVFCRCLTALLA
jgi:hypothetical protein